MDSGVTTGSDHHKNDDSVIGTALPPTKKQQPHRLRTSSTSSRNNTSSSRGVSFAAYFACVILTFPMISFLLLGKYSSLTTTTSVQTAVETLLKESIFTPINEANQVAHIPGRMYNLAGLSCEAYGGPNDEAAAQEMVYWQDIPSDAKHISPMHPKERNAPTQYLTFEPDRGGWNNIRMAMETVIGMAFAMGRTLVLPPEAEMYLLKSKKTIDGDLQRDKFTFSHFFHTEAIHNEHPGLDIIHMKEYLEREAMQGHMIDQMTKQVVFPPGNRTDWDGASRNEMQTLFFWLQSVSHIPSTWNPENCVAVFPASRDDADLEEIQSLRETLVKNTPNYEEFVGHPLPIDATPLERLKEMWAERSDICLYDHELQNTQYIHFPVGKGSRLLTHFYAFLFFQDYRQDLWMKRFIRDHVRYTDEIQCAAARIVAKVRERAKRRDPIQNPDGVFDAMHVRRGDFQYKKTRVSAKELLKMARKKIPDGASLFIATDEREKIFFRPLMDHYHVMFLDDFMEDELKGVNSNYFGMIDALVATRSRTFYGCWFSTFTGYINRLRGYHADKEKLPGYEEGIINSYYYALEDRFDNMQMYYPVKKSFYAREFPTAWRLIDSTVEE